MRIDGRNDDELRTVDIQPGPMDYADGCVIISTGNTKVLCSASIDERAVSYTHLRAHETGRNLVPDIRLSLIHI